MALMWFHCFLGLALTALCGAGIARDVLTLTLPDNRTAAVYVFAPEVGATSETLPTLILWHGGGWTAGEPELLFPHAEALASEGFLCLVPDYPLAGVERGLGGCVEDARAIAAWIMSDAGPSKLDRAAVYLLGESAGGHLAAMLASDPETGPWSGVILWNPVLDLREIPWLESDRHGPLPNRAALSPITRLAAGHPPTLILHGADDAVVSVKQALHWRDQAELLGVACRLTIFPETGHAFALDAGGVGYTEALKRSLNFLRMPKAVIDRSADTPFHIVHAFSPEAGWQPFTELSLDGDTAWGAAHSGGSVGGGTLFRLDLTNGALDVMHAFSKSEGYEPYTGNLFAEDAVWGITKFGGSGKGGTLYRFTPSTGAFETLAAFGPNESTVAWAPHAGPILVGDFLWGTTFHGGPTRWGGALYRIPREGGSLELMQGFSAETGEHPTGQLLFHDGWIYGTLSDYGKTDPRRAGALFRIQPDGSAFEIIHRFAGGGLGAHPYDRLVAHPSGLLLGTTFGRFESPHDGGTLFSWNPTTARLTTLADFNLLAMAGGKPNGSLVFEDDPETLLLTTHGFLDNDHGYPGVALRARFAQTSPPRLDRIEILHTFSGDNAGSTPMRSPVFRGGELWGLTAFGHGSDATVEDPTQTGGLLYRLDLPPPFKERGRRVIFWASIIALASVIIGVIAFLLRKR